MSTLEPINVVVTMHDVNSPTPDCGAREYDTVDDSHSTSSAAEKPSGFAQGGVATAMLLLLCCWVASAPWATYGVSIGSADAAGSSPDPDLRWLWRHLHPRRSSPQTPTLRLCDSTVGLQHLQRDSSGLRLGKWTVPGSHAVLRAQQAVASAHYLGSLKTAADTKYHNKPPHNVPLDPADRLVSDRHGCTVVDSLLLQCRVCKPASTSEPGSNPGAPTLDTVTSLLTRVQMSGTQLAKVVTKGVIAFLVSQSGSRGASRPQVAGAWTGF
jgi:hypothetical protein